MGLNQELLIKAPWGGLRIEIHADVIVGVHFLKKAPKRVSLAKTPFEKEVIRQMREYFEGKRLDFELPFALAGTDFQNQVWKQLWMIPYGNTESYQGLAKVLERPKAARAVARAMATNRLPLILPCHRIIASNKTLGGFSGGLSVKKWLLEHERENKNH
jgi:O-6-methylguanine DNA methyltransferase